LGRRSLVASVSPVDVKRLSLAEVDVTVWSLVVALGLGEGPSRRPDRLLAQRFGYYIARSM
jgi:hypothetical protein